MDEMTKRITAYLLHDAVNNMEGYITDYRHEELERAQDEGMLIIAEYNDGSRAVVNAFDVVEPQPEVNGVTLVQPIYVNERMEAVIAVFDALASEYLTPQVATMSVGEEETPADGFFAALEKLKEVANGNA